MTFSDLGVNPPFEVVADDLLAVHLLDITWRPEVVRVLLGSYKQELSSMLADIPQNVDLWAASDQVLRRIDTIWDALTGIEGVGTASTTKLLARKRPRLCPIGDSIVKRAVDVPGRTWDVLRWLLSDPKARAEVEALRPPEAAGASLLRILDVALWVAHSKCAAAQLVREKCGMPPVQLWPYIAGLIPGPWFPRSGDHPDLGQLLDRLGPGSARPKHRGNLPCLSRMEFA